MIRRRSERRFPGGGRAVGGARLPVLANLALYHGTVGLGFLSVDDPDYVQNNPYIESLQRGQPEAHPHRALRRELRPANLLSYALDVALAGGKSAFGDPSLERAVAWVGGVHGLSAGVHHPPRHLATAAAAAGLFLLHPAHVEVVAWISSRKDLVATGFAALSMAAYLGYRRRYGWGKAGMR